jgi:hypothetical protein
MQTEKKQPVNKHSVAVHVGDGRKIAPGEPIPADVSPAVRKALEATGHFK